MKITAIVGSYHKGGVIDSLVDEMLTVANSRGADVGKIHLTDQRIEYCQNCQSCTQAVGDMRGKCVIDDDMSSICDEIDASDGLIFASPVNCGTVTALMKCFTERLVCYGYWPWDKMCPSHRIKTKTKRAVVLSSCAAPGWLGRIFFSAAKIMKSAAILVGAKKVDTLMVGQARHAPGMKLRQRDIARARKLAHRLLG